jgi:hypothetical protein
MAGPAAESNGPRKSNGPTFGRVSGVKFSGAEVGFEFDGLGSGEERG